MYFFCETILTKVSCQILIFAFLSYYLRPFGVAAELSHKTLRMTGHYSHLEAARKSIIQSALASHYAGSSKAVDI